MSGGGIFLLNNITGLSAGPVKFTSSAKLKRIQRSGVMKACFATKETVTIFLKTQEPFIRKDYFLTTSFMSLAAF